MGVGDLGFGLHSHCGSTSEQVQLAKEKCKCTCRVDSIFKIARRCESDDRHG